MSEEQRAKENAKKKKGKRIVFSPFKIVININSRETSSSGTEEECEEEDQGAWSVEDLASNFLPKEACKHLKAARVEGLKALRAMLDDKIEKAEKKTAKSKQRVEKINIEVDED